MTITVLKKETTNQVGEETFVNEYPDILKLGYDSGVYELYEDGDTTPSHSFLSSQYSILIRG